MYSILHTKKKGSEKYQWDKLKKLKRHKQQMSETIFLPRIDISFIQGEDLFEWPPKEGKYYEFENDFLLIDEKSNWQWKRRNKNGI